MPYFRLIPVAVVVCLACLALRTSAQDPASAPSTPAPTPAPAPEEVTLAERHLDGAMLQTRARERIAAKFEQDVDMLNQKFKLDGFYYKDKDHHVRLEMTLVDLGDASSKLLQVCDGKVLWEYQNVLGMRQYRRRDITPILQKLENPALDAGFKDLVIANLGFSGPDAMLRGLRQKVRFDQVLPDKLDGVDVWVVGGKWKDRSGLLAANDRQIAPTTPLPPYVPSNIVVYIGQADGWPYKIEMIGAVPSMLQDEIRAVDPATGRPVGQPRKAPKIDPSRITVLYKPLPITDIKPGLFDFQPPSDVPTDSILDDTKPFLEGLDGAIQMEAAKKKNEAAKAAEGDVPFLKTQPLNPTGNPDAAAPGTAPLPR